MVAEDSKQSKHNPIQSQRGRDFGGSLVTLQMMAPVDNLNSFRNRKINFDHSISAVSMVLHCLLLFFPHQPHLKYNNVESWPISLEILLTSLGLSWNRQSRVVMSTVEEAELVLELVDIELDLELQRDPGMPLDQRILYMRSRMDHYNRLFYYGYCSSPRRLLWILCNSLL